MKKAFIIYLDSLDILSKLSDEQAGKLLKAFNHYHLHGEVPELDTLLDIVITPFINQFKRDDEKYNSVVEKRKEAGKKGGLANQANAKQIKQMLPNDSKIKQTVANQADKDKDTVKDSDSDSDTLKGIQQQQKKELPLFVQEIKDELNTEFYSYLQHVVETEIEIELLDELAAKKDAYFTLVQNIPAFKRLIAYQKLPPEKIHKGVRDWIKHQATSKAEMRWKTWADMAEHCNSFIKKQQQ